MEVGPRLIALALANQVPPGGADPVVVAEPAVRPARAACRAPALILAGHLGESARQDALVDDAHDAGQALVPGFGVGDLDAHEAAFGRDVPVGGGDLASLGELLADGFRVDRQLNLGSGDHRVVGKLLRAAGDAGLVVGDVGGGVPEVDAVDVAAEADRRAVLQLDLGRRPAVSFGFLEAEALLEERGRQAVLPAELLILAEHGLEVELDGALLVEPGQPVAGLAALLQLLELLAGDVGQDLPVGLRVRLGGPRPAACVQGREELLEDRVDQLATVDRADGPGLLVLGTPGGLDLEDVVQEVAEGAAGPLLDAAGADGVEAVQATRKPAHERCHGRDIAVELGEAAGRPSGARPQAAAEGQVIAAGQRRGQQVSASLMDLPGLGHLALGHVDRIGGSRQRGGRRNQGPEPGALGPGRQLGHLDRTHAPAFQLGHDVEQPA